MDADLFYLIHDMPTYLYIQIVGILLLPTSSGLRWYLNPKTSKNSQPSSSSLTKFEKHLLSY